MNYTNIFNESILAKMSILPQSIKPAFFFNSPHSIAPLDLRSSIRFLSMYLIGKFYTCKIEFIEIFQFWTSFGSLFLRIAASGDEFPIWFTLAIVNIISFGRTSLRHVPSTNFKNGTEYALRTDGGFLRKMKKFAFLSSVLQQWASSEYFCC